jgi:hypothetical protein
MDRPTGIGGTATGEQMAVADRRDAGTVDGETDGSGPE